MDFSADADGFLVSIVNLVEESAADDPDLPPAEEGIRLESGSRSISYGFTRPELDPLGFAVLDGKAQTPAEGITIPVHDTLISFAKLESPLPQGTVGWLDLPAAATRGNWRAFFGHSEVSLPLLQLDELALQGLPPGSCAIRLRLPDEREALWNFTIAERDSVVISLDDWARRAR